MIFVILGASIVMVRRRASRAPAPRTRSRLRARRTASPSRALFTGPRGLRSPSPAALRSPVPSAPAPACVPGPAARYSALTGHGLFQACRVLDGHERAAGPIPTTTSSRTCGRGPASATAAVAQVSLRPEGSRVITHVGGSGEPHAPGRATREPSWARLVGAAEALPGWVGEGLVRLQHLLVFREGEDPLPMYTC